MSLVIRPVDGVGESANPDHDEVTQYAPKWAREPRSRLRQVAAGRLAAELPGDTALGPARPCDLDAVDRDATLTKLLQSPSLDPAAIPEAPARDSVGLALGMIARLMVAGSAAAGVGLLLVGGIPLSFKPLSGETTATASKGWSSETDRIAKSTARVGEEQRMASLDSAPAIASETVRPPQAVVPDARTPDAEEIARLTRRGEDLLAQGDIAAARLILIRAADAQDARAALALGATYDPVVLKQLGVVGFRPDVELARTWYEKAAQYGSTEAPRRLPALRKM
jgi:hypothetical protein